MSATELPGDLIHVGSVIKCEVCDTKFVVKIFVDKNISRYPGEYAQIPEHLMKGMVDFVMRGRVPGDFLTAVIENNLSGAIGRADLQSLSCIKVIVRWFYNIAPGDCWGSPEKLSDWTGMADKEWTWDEGAKFL